MGRGGARANAGRPRKSVEVHVRAGTYRKARHGALPANVLPMPTVAADTWSPSEEELAAIGPAGRVLIEKLSQPYVFTVLDGVVLLELGHAEVALTAVRSIDRTGLTLDKILKLERVEQTWQRQKAALLAQLRISE